MSNIFTISPLLLSQWDDRYVFQSLFFAIVCDFTITFLFSYFKKKIKLTKRNNAEPFIYLYLIHIRLHCIPSIKLYLIFKGKCEVLYLFLQFFAFQGRGGSRTAATSKMKRFMIIVNSFQPLTIITKCTNLDVAAALGLPLQSTVKLAEHY